MKITTADRIFSKYIRARDGYRCQRCGAKHRANSQGLHCAHYWSRGRWATRFREENAIALCYGCHRYADSHISEKNKIFTQKLGEKKFLDLQKMKHKTTKDLKKTKKEIEKEARMIFKKKLEKIEEGSVTGLIKISLHST